MAEDCESFPNGFSMTIRFHPLRKKNNNISYRVDLRDKNVGSFGGVKLSIICFSYQLSVLCLRPKNY